MSEREQLEQAISHLETQRAILGDAVVDPAIAALREKLVALEDVPTLPRRGGLAGVEEQRKQVTILFADISGFTAMSETMDAEEVRNTMNALWTRLDGTITSHGGMIDKHIGDAVMALFGAPTAREDDPERAIRAALAMQADMTAFREERKAELAVRIGINTGPVLLGEVGTTSEYTAMGDAVNLASRLEHAAPVGGILISHDTYRHVRGIFDVQPLDPIRIKGKAEPIQVYVVLRAKPRAFRMPTRGVEGIETRMIGREAELGQLQEALQATLRKGEARAITIVGEAGVGKSRLLYEFRNWLDLQAESIVIFRGRATQERSNLPYSLIRDLFAFRFEIQDSDPAAVAREKLEQGIVAPWGTGDVEGTEEKAHFIGQLIGFDFSESPHLRGIIGDARQIHDRAFHYVAEFFAAAAPPSGRRERRAVAIYLEDIHWADDGSLDLVDYLVWKCRRAPLLIIALTRPTLFERRPSWGVAGAPFESVQMHTRLELHPLSTQNSHRLVEEILQRVEDVPPDLRDLIVRGAEGNPFYVEELIKMLIEDGVIVKGPERWRVETERLAEVRVPPTLTGVLQARLDGLPPVERETLQRASVVGRVFWDSTVVRIYESADGRTDGRETAAALRALQGKELVFERQASAFVEAREHIFKHAILRDVTYESVLRRLRRVYHAQAAAWLIEHSGERVGEYAGLIGEHYERAGERAQAAEWYGRAGRQAQDTYALETAADYYQKALALEERWEWRKGQVEALHVLGRRDEEQAGLRALEAASEAPVFEVAYLWGQYYEAIGEYSQAHAEAERALAASRSRGDMTGEMRSLTMLGLIAYRQGDDNRAKTWYKEAESLFQGDESYSDVAAQASIQVLRGLGAVYLHQGDYEQAQTHFELGLALSRRGGDRASEAQMLNYLGQRAFNQRDFAEAEAYHRQALEIRRAIGDRAGEGMSLYNLAMTVRNAGDYGQAQEYYSEALAIQQAIGDRWYEANILNSMGIMYHELGDLITAQTCLEQSRQIAQDIGDEAGQAYVLSNLGPVMRDQGDLAAAEQLLTDGLALFQRENNEYAMSFFLSYLSTVSVQAGRLEQATELAQRALALRRELDLTLLTTADLTTLAAVHLATGDAAQAMDYAQQALTILDGCGGEGPESPHRDYFVCYQVLAAVGQEGTAWAALQSAYDLVTTRADKITDLAMRQSFLQRVPINREIVQEYENVIRKECS